MKLHVGDQVEVVDPGLAQLRAIMAKFGDDPGPNNRGVVAEIWDDGTVLVEFPIGDDNPEGHSQVSPYPPSQVRKRRGKGE